MRRRDIPPPVRYRRDPAFSASKRCRDAVEQVLNNKTIGRGFTGDERLLILVDAAKTQHPDAIEPVLGKHFQEATNLLRPPCVAPGMNLPTDDLVAAWQQPEAADLWRRWAPDTRRAYASSSYEGTRAALVVTATRGPHFRRGRDVLVNNPRLTECFEKLAFTVRPASLPGKPMIVREYTSTTRHVPRLVDGFAYEAMATCVQVNKELARLFPNSPIGQYLCVDGSDYASWTPQRSGNRPNGDVDPAREARYRSRTPEADFRAIGYDRDGAFDPYAVGSALDETASAPGGDKSRPGRVAKFWRGYMAIVVSDAVTGVPLVGMLPGAAIHEPIAVRTLMPLLFQLWPDVPVITLIADAAWDTAALYEYLEPRFGIHPIVRRKPSLRERGGRLFPYERGVYRGGIARIDGDGTAHCRRHDARLTYEGMDVPSRDGLAPGEPDDPVKVERQARRFRSRWRCRYGCGRLSLPTHLAWTALPYYPNIPDRPDLFALRVAALGRRSLAETVFSSLKAGYGQAVRSGHRVRFFDRETCEALMWLSLVTRSLLLLADARRGLDELDSAA